MYSNRDGPRPAVNYYRKGRPLCSERQIEKKRQRHHAAGSRFADKAQSAGNLARERLQFSVQSSQFTVAFIAGTTQRKAQSADIMVASVAGTPPHKAQSADIMVAYNDGTTQRKAHSAGIMVDHGHPPLPPPLIGHQLRRSGMFIEQERPLQPAPLISGSTLKTECGEGMKTTGASVTGTKPQKAQSAGIMVANRRHPATPTPPPGLEFRRNDMFIEQECPLQPAPLIRGRTLITECGERIKTSGAKYWLCDYGVICAKRTGLMIDN